MVNTYTIDELDKLKKAEYPYIEKQQIGEYECSIYIDNYRSEDWFGYLGWLRKTKDPERARNLTSNCHILRYKRLIKEGDTVFDCGTNEGYLTLIFAKLVGGRGRVYAFEPVLKNIEVMKKTLELNNINNVTIIHSVVGNQSGVPVLFGGEIVHTKKGKDTYYVNSVKLDDFIDLKPNFIKVDVEGYELPVVEGSLEILKLNPIWEIEMHLSHTVGIHMKKSYGFDPDNIFKIFKNLNYSVKNGDREVVFGEEPQGCIYCRKNEEK